MKGTEKQIKWAEDIKAGLFATLDSMEEKCEEASYSRETVKLMRERYTEMFANNDFTAAEIIEHRDHWTPKTLFCIAMQIERGNLK